jgi:hypothetical protein
VRNTVEKSVTLPQNLNYSANFSAGRTGVNGLRTGSPTIPVYVYFIAGFVLGAIVTLGYNRLRKKR